VKQQANALALAFHAFEMRDDDVLIVFVRDLAHGAKSPNSIRQAIDWLQHRVISWVSGARSSEPGGRPRARSKPP
jgi:hypothetical protein